MPCVTASAPAPMAFTCHHRHAHFNSHRVTKSARKQRPTFIPPSSLSFHLDKRIDSCNSSPVMPETPDIVVASQDTIDLCYQDLVSFTIGHSRYDEDKPILIDAEDPARFVTLKYARGFVSGLIAALKSHGVNEGDTVCFHLYNDIVYPLLFLAVVGVGARVTAANPAYTVAELQHHFTISNTTFVITGDDHADRAKIAAAKVGNITDIGRGSLKDFVDSIDTTTAYDWHSFNDKHRSINTIALLGSTSGTTGLPKMAARSHHSLVMENIAIEDKVEKPYQVRRLLCTPFFHGFTLPLAVVSALRLGLPTYVMRRFDQTKFLNAVGLYSITETAMPAPMLVRFNALPDEERSSLKGLCKVWSGGAALAEQTQQQASHMFAHDARICQVWGMTEGGWMTTFHYPETDNSGSVGRLIATYEAKVCSPNTSDPDQEEAFPPTSTGEIWIRGPVNMHGYFEDAASSSALMTKDGWMKTGDLGYFTEDGRLFVKDRLKDLIKVRGWQVAPTEIEARLLEHPDIIDTGVIGINMPEQGSEVPRAYVVLREGSRLNEDAIKHHMLGELAKYKVGDCQIRFIDAIPKSPSGKILKTILRREAIAEAPAITVRKARDSFTNHDSNAGAAIRSTAFI